MRKPDSRNVALVLSAAAAPGVVAAARSVMLIMGPSDAPASTVVSLALATLWIGFVLLWPWLRHLVVDLGRWLLGRIPFVAFFLVAIASLLLATTHPVDLFWLCVASCTILLCVAAAREAIAVSPRRFTWILLALGFNGVLLVGCDVLFRLFVLPSKSHNSIFIEHDASLGWKLRSGFSVERDTEHYRARETINSFGFRTREIPIEKPEGTRRIVLLGDSHTEGYTVSDGETYGERLEALLSREIPVQVVSLGVGGYSTDQELLAYLHYGRRYSPDLVVLQFCANDVRFNTLDRYWRGLKPTFKRHGEMLVLEGVPVPNLRRTGLGNHPLLKHSAIVTVLDASLSRYAVIRDQEAHNDSEAWHVTDLLLRDLSHLVEGDGSNFVVFNATPDDEDADEQIRTIAKKRSIAFLDIFPAFDGDITRHRVTDDLHWNQEGHEAVARLLAEALAPLLGADPARVTASE